MEDLDWSSLLGVGPAIVSYGVELAGSMLADGFAYKVFGAFASLAGAIAGVRILLEIIEGEGAGEALASLVELILAVGLFLFLLQNYGWIFGDSMRSLFGAMASAMGFGAGLDDPFAGLKALMDALRKGFGAMFSPDDSWVTLISKFFGNLVSVVALFVAMITVGAATVVYIAVYLMGDVLAGAALAVGPFFVALGIWDVTRGWFRNWLEFLVVAFLYKIVAAVLVMLLIKALGGHINELAASMTYMSAGASGPAAVSLALAVKAIILAGVISALLLSAPSIAHGLARGGISLSEGSVRGVIPGLGKGVRGGASKGT